MKIPDFLFCFGCPGQVRLALHHVMYWRRKKNKSDVVSVQVIDKSSGKYKVIKTIGSSAIESEVDKLIRQAQYFIDSYGGQQQFDFILGDDARYFQSIYENIQQVQLPGPEIIPGKLPILPSIS